MGTGQASLGSKRGAGKKKEKLVAMERERFARNLAEMAKGPGGSAERWAAVRGFVGRGVEGLGEGSTA